MKTARVTVRFDAGLHARAAASLVQLLKRFRCRTSLRMGDRGASANSIVSIRALAVPFNARIEVQASGEDEDAAIRAAEAFFENTDEAAARRIEGDLAGTQG